MTATFSLMSEFPEEVLPSRSYQNILLFHLHQCWRAQMVLFQSSEIQQHAHLQNSLSHVCISLPVEVQTIKYNSKFFFVSSCFKKGE